MHPTVARLLILVVVVEVVLPLAVYVARNRILFFPTARPSPEEGLADFGAVPARIVRIARPDGRRLAAYDVAPREIGAEAPVVLFLHGNAGNIAHRAGLAARFASKAKVRVLMIDYSGFGGNDGSPSEDTINDDALAAYDHLVAEGVQAAQLVVFGESIGGAPALLLATKRRVAGVVLQSTFSSLSAMALRTYPWMPLISLLVRGAFPNADRIATLDVPVLIVHGRRDDIIPFSEGERLHAAKPDAEFLPVDGAAHNDFFSVAGDAYLRGLGERFRRWTRR